MFKKQIQRPAHKPLIRRFALLLAAFACCLGLPGWNYGAKAAEIPTNLGLAQHGIKAYNEGWQYSYGGKGETVGGVRVSDCAGLIYAYFSDLGVGGCMGGATSQATQNCIFTGGMSEGLPRIHGLALTILEPGATDDYSHIGIYIGNNESCENSDYGTNMVRGSVFRRGWTTWHLFDNGVLYPRSGWYEFDGKMVHYTDYEYDVDLVIDGYTIGSDGFAQLADGTPAPVDPSMLSSEFVPASEVKEWLSTHGWSGTYNPEDPSPDFDHNARVSVSSALLRSQPSTDSSIVLTLSQGTPLRLGAPVQGASVTVGGTSSSLWYPAETAHGQTGYISSLLVSLTLSAPSFSCDGESVTIQAVGMEDNIYYTTDGSQPDENSYPYVSPVYELNCTYKAVVIKDGVAGPVATATVMGNGAIFTDFTYSDWFAQSVDKAVCLGIFSGTGQGSFSPKNKLTRAQFVKVLANLFGQDVSGYEFGDDIPAFEDVSSSAYYYHELAWAVRAGIVTPDSKFRPNDEIPREQMCTMLVRYARYADLNTNAALGEPFADDEEISSWAKDAVYRMRSLGVVNGVGENRFNPKGSSDRAAACTMMVNFYEKVISLTDTSGDNLPATPVK